MLGSNREFVLFMAGLAVAGCLMAAGVVLATSHLFADQRMAGGASADLQTIDYVGRHP